MSLISKVFIENNVILKRFLKRFLDNEHDIEDVVQNTYIRAAAAEKKQVIRSPKSFVFTVAKNLALTELNKKSNKIQEELDECILSSLKEPVASMEMEIEAEQHIKMYCETINELPEKAKKVYILRKVYGLKHKEIAKELNMSLSSVEKNLKLAILSCKDVMQRKQAMSEWQKPSRINVRGAAK